MSLYKRGKWYHMDATVNGIRYRVPLKTTNWQQAKKDEKEKLNEIAEGKFGGIGKISRVGFSIAIDDYLVGRELHKAPRTYQIEYFCAKPLKLFFGDLAVRRITGEMIRDYQAKRKKDGVSGRTINMEVGLLRRVMKTRKQWGRLVDEVQALNESPKAARVLTPEEKKILLDNAASNRGWQVAYLAAVVSFNTGMRHCELLGLQLRDVDLFEKTVTIRRATTKTDAGNRIIPLNRLAVLAFAGLLDRAQKLGSVAASDYLLPSCENGHIDLTKPMKGFRTAWRNLTALSGLKGFRFHDTRHCCITELLEANVGDSVVMEIVGHIDKSVLRIYSHIRVEARRKAVECLESTMPLSLPSACLTEEERPN